MTAGVYQSRNAVRHQATAQISSGALSEPLPADAPEHAIDQKLSALHDILARYELWEACQQIRDKQEDLRRPDELLVFVFGEGNFGKSSLINQLLGRVVAKVNILPETWRVDLYRAVPPDVAESATIRRRGRRGDENMSAADAERLCDEQSQQRKGRQKDQEAEPLDDQIVEVQWRLHGLSLPPGIVLVDTPGFAQFRDNLDQARATLLGNDSGVVHDVSEVYEHFFHRAHVVLWAFKATKLEDRDTIEVFAKLHERGKHILGVLTCVDRVPHDDRAKLMERAQQLFGPTIKYFFPVVCGGKSNELGFGVPELRAVVGQAVAAAPNIRIQEAVAFTNAEIGNARKWLSGLGDALVHNASRINVYCTAASSVLLREAAMWQTIIEDGQEHIDRLVYELADQYSPGSGQVEAFAPVRLQGKPTIAYDVRIKEGIHVNCLQIHRANAVEEIGANVTTEAGRIAREFTIRQITIQPGGEFMIRPLERWIEPLDLGPVVRELTAFDITPPDGFLNHIRSVQPDFFVSSGATRTQQVLVNAVDAMAEPAMTFVSKLTRRVAEAILATADKGVDDLYAGETLLTLASMAAKYDTDIVTLADLGGIDNDPRRTNYYCTLVRIWSSRDDNRLAAINRVSDYLVRNADALRATAETFLDSTIMSNNFCGTAAGLARDYLKVHSHVRFEPEPSTIIVSPSISVSKIVGLGMMSALPAYLDCTFETKTLFEEREVEMIALADYQVIRLTGLNAEMIGAIVNEWKVECACSAHANVTVTANQYKFTDELDERLKSGQAGRGHSSLAIGVSVLSLALDWEQRYYAHWLRSLPDPMQHMASRALDFGGVKMTLIALCLWAIERAVHISRDKQLKMDIESTWEKVKQKKTAECINLHVPLLARSLANRVAEHAKDSWVRAASTVLQPETIKRCVEKRLLADMTPLDNALEANTMWVGARSKPVT